MKNLSILIILIFLGCEKSKESVSLSNSNEPIKVYNWDDYEKVKRENSKRKIIIEDTICTYETKRAETDIKNGKLVYTCYRPMTNEVINELDLILRQYKIRAEKGSTSCWSPPEGFKMFCYQEKMQKEIEKKYSQRWLDSLEELALKNYANKNPDKVYFKNGDLYARKINN